MEPSEPKGLVKGKNTAREGARKRAQKKKKKEARRCADDFDNRGSRFDTDSDDDDDYNDRHGNRKGGRKMTGSAWGDPGPYAAPPPPPEVPPPPMDSAFEDCSDFEESSTSGSDTRSEPTEPVSPRRQEEAEAGPLADETSPKGKREGEAEVNPLLRGVDLDRLRPGKAEALKANADSALDCVSKVRKLLGEKRKLEEELQRLDQEERRHPAKKRDKSARPKTENAGCFHAKDQHRREAQTKAVPCPDLTELDAWMVGQGMVQKMARELPWVRSMNKKEGKKNQTFSMATTIMRPAEWLRLKITIFFTTRTVQFQGPPPLPGDATESLMAHLGLDLDVLSTAKVKGSIHDAEAWGDYGQ
jgi:hypothetical protein